jgi:putative ABC transport system permease protein
MNPIIKNFLSVIRRFKLAAVLNILGLSVAFAAFMVIMIQLDYDYGFDKFHKDSDKIFRMEFVNKTTASAVISRPLAERFFESSPHIVAGTITNPWTGKLFFHIEKDDVRSSYEEDAMGVSPEYTDVFTFDFVEGSEDALKTPENVIIPLSLSRKIFGNESAVGQQLITNGGNPTVGAVYHDFPSNSVVNNCIYAAISENENKQNWNNWN